MNKVELVAAIAANANLTKADAARALEATVKAISDALVAGEPVQLIGFGTFAIAERAERNGINPRTGAAIKIAEKKVIKFKAGKALNDRL